MYVKGIEGRERSGFILLESILALALFAIVAVGFTVAIQQVAFTANSSGESMRVQRMLETLLTEASKVVRFEEVEEGIGEDEKGVRGRCGDWRPSSCLSRSHLKKGRVRLPS